MINADLSQLFGVYSVVARDLSLKGAPAGRVKRPDLRSRRSVGRATGLAIFWGWMNINLEKR